MDKRHKAWVRITAAFLSVVLVAAIFLGLAQLGVEINQNWKRWVPDYEKTDIVPLLQKTERTEEEYQLLYEQTGLTKTGIDGLLSRGNAQKILDIQKKFFENRAVSVDSMAPFSFYETCESAMPHAFLENGDIILTASVYVSFFRYGHSALVVNADKGELLESLEPGTFSKITYESSLFDFSTFLIVRPKADKSVRQEVASYAATNLVNIPYRLTAGIFTRKFEEVLKETQCTHIVWWAYKKFGIDLDGNGGKIVKPQDIFLSDKVELVQAYGFPLDTLWR